MIFDSHAHLNDSAFDGERDELIASLSLSGVEGFCEIAYDMDSSYKAIELADKYENVYAAIGIHPENADKKYDIEELRELSKNKKVVAIGEIGLDYHYDEPERDIQKKCFIDNINLAKSLKLPVIIHSRDAAKDTYDIVISTEASKNGGIVHCFSYPIEMAKLYINLGMYIGIGGVLTFKNSKKLVEVAENIPLERIVLETDCPYMAPVPVRGTRNDPSNLPYVVKKLAEIKKLPEEEVIRVTRENVKKIYGV